jgi:hypothetical protein
MTDSSFNATHKTIKELPQSIYKAMNDTSELISLEYNDLLLLLTFANNEMIEIEKYLLESQKVMANANENLDNARQYSNNKYLLGCGTIGISIMSIAMIIGMIVEFKGIISVISIITILFFAIVIIRLFLWLSKFSIRQKESLTGEASVNKQRANEIYEHAQQLINNAKAIYVIPPDYRYTFALSSMISILRRKLADNWMSVANLFEGQVYKNENISILKESLEYQKITALASSISAVVDITKLFV